MILSRLRPEALGRHAAGPRQRIQFTRTVVALPNIQGSLRAYSAFAEPPILVKIEGGKATVTLNRPRTGNSLDPDVVSELSRSLKELETNHAVRVVVLTGSGKHFCTGMNLGAEGEGLKGNVEEQFERAKLMFHTVETYRKPVIALLNGSCWGGGNGLAMACDIRIAAKPDITFTLSEVKVGFIPAIISRYIIREWGVPKSREAMMTARAIPVQELHELYAVHYITEDVEAGHQKVDEVVAQLMQGAPGAQGDVKRLILSGATESGASHWQTVKGLFVDIMRPNLEGKYGLECFQAKKKPDWSTLKGRR